MNYLIFYRIDCLLYTYILKILIQILNKHKKFFLDISISSCLKVKEEKRSF